MNLLPTPMWFQRQDAKDAKSAKNGKPSFLGDLGVLRVLALEESSGCARSFAASRVARSGMEH